MTFLQSALIMLITNSLSEMNVFATKDVHTLLSPVVMPLSKIFSMFIISSRSHLLMQILHTTMGDIHMKLYPEECPKTVENFTTHCRNGYYDNLIFHRVIRGFMIQTGDPLGDGTGGQSIWGREFEDEFHKR